MVSFGFGCVGCLAALCLYYGRERSLLHRNAAEPIFWALFYGWSAYVALLPDSPIHQMRPRRCEAVERFALVLVSAALGMRVQARNYSKRLRSSIQRLDLRKLARQYKETLAARVSVCRLVRCLEAQPTSIFDIKGHARHMRAPPVEQEVHRALQDCCFAGPEQLLYALNSADVELPRLFAVAGTTDVLELLKQQISYMDVVTKARLIDSLQRQSEFWCSRSLQELAAELLIQTPAAELTTMKSLLDEGGDYYNLHKLVFSDLADDLRERVLERVENAGRKLRVVREDSPESDGGFDSIDESRAPRRQAEGPSTVRKVLSDIDDTLYSSGGHFPAGADHRFPKGQVYPGVLALFRELDIGHQESQKRPPDLGAPSNGGRGATPATQPVWGRRVSAPDVPQSAVWGRRVSGGELPQVAVWGRRMSGGDAKQPAWQRLASDSMDLRSSLEPTWGRLSTPTSPLPVRGKCQQSATPAWQRGTTPSIEQAAAPAWGRFVTMEGDAAAGEAGNKRSWRQRGKQGYVAFRLALTRTLFGRGAAESDSDSVWLRMSASEWLEVSVPETETVGSLRSLLAETRRSNNTCSLGATGDDFADISFVPPSRRVMSNLVFLSARPHAYKDYTESTSYRLFQRLRSRGLLHCMPTLLSGRMRSSAGAAIRGMFIEFRKILNVVFVGALLLIAVIILYRSDALCHTHPICVHYGWLVFFVPLLYGAKLNCMGKGSSWVWEPVGEEKVRSFLQYQRLYSECTAVFFGDNGQGDLWCAEQLGQRAFDRGSEDAVVEACFIHEVIPRRKQLSSLPETMTDEEKDAEWERRHIYFHRTYVGAAINAYDCGLISAEGLSRVGTAAVEDLLRMWVKHCDSPHDWRTIGWELNDDVMRANALLPHGVPPIALMPSSFGCNKDLEQAMHDNADVGEFAFLTPAPGRESFREFV